MKVAVIGSIPRDFGLSKETLKTAAASFAERSRSRVGGVWHEVVVHLVRDEYGRHVSEICSVDGIKDGEVRLRSAAV